MNNNLVIRAHSSAGEHLNIAQGVSGSNPDVVHVANLMNEKVVFFLMMINLMK